MMKPSILVVIAALWINVSLAETVGSDEDQFDLCVNTLNDCHVYATNCKSLVQMQQERLEAQSVELQERESILPGWAWMLIGAAGAVTAMRFVD